MQYKKNIGVKKILVADSIQSIALSLKTAFEVNGEYIVDVFDNPFSNVTNIRFRIL